MGITEQQKKEFLAGRREHLHPPKNVWRDLGPLKKAEEQKKLYSPCACGSGKKYKFCCKTGGTH